MIGSGVHSPSRRSPSVKALGAAVLLVMLGLLAPTTARAHTPHDEMLDVAVSPDFMHDQTVYTISRAYLMRSLDGGDTWHRLVNGLDNKRRPSSVEVAPTDADVVYLATRGDAVYKSIDAGNSWANRSEGISNKNLLFLEVSPHGPDVVFAGTASDEGELFATADGGEAWNLVPDVAQVTAVAFDPSAPQVVVAGDQQGQIHVSADGGSTWSTHALDVAGAGGVSSIVIEPDEAGGRTLFVGTDLAGVHMSADDGESFTSVNEGLTDPLIIDLLVTSSGDVRTLWASTSNEGTFRSTDFGQTWTRSAEGLTTDEMAARIGAPDFGPMAAAPAPADIDPTMFVGTFDGLFRSTGPDDDWEYLTTQVSSIVSGLAVSPGYPDDSTVAVATYINGAFITDDDGVSWEPINDGLATQFEWTSRPDYVARLTGISFYPSFVEDDMMHAGLRGNYLESDDRGATWSSRAPEEIVRKDEFPPDYYLLAYSPDFASDRTIVLGTDGGKVYRHTGDADAISLIAEPGVEFTALTISPDFVNDQTLIGGTPDGPTVSTDGGESWTLDDELGRAVTSIGISPGFATDQQAWAGTPRGLFTSTDGGVSWSSVLDTPFALSAYIEAVVVSPEFEDDGTMLVSVRGIGLFKSTDRGETFAEIAPQLIEDQVMFGSFYHPTTEPIVFSPGFAQDQTIFGIAEEHVYRSTDAGDTWTTLDLPVTTHDPASTPSLPLLVTPRFESEGSRSFDTPVGTLSAVRVGAAVVAALIVFAGLSLPMIRRKPLVGNLWIRFAVSGVVLVAVLALLAV